MKDDFGRSISTLVKKIRLSGVVYFGANRLLLERFSIVFDCFPTEIFFCPSVLHMKNITEYLKIKVQISFSL